jgi:hypothetical protein
LNAGFRARREKRPQPPMAEADDHVQSVTFKVTPSREKLNF